MAKLSIKEKIGYGLGDTASHFVWDMVGFWILIFYTDTFGISAAAAGTIMLIARAWDMVSDPLWESLQTAPTPDGENSVPIFSGWLYPTAYWQC